MKVILAIEQTPSPIEQKTDLTALVPTQFRDGAGGTSEGASGPEMFAKKGDKKTKAGKLAKTAAESGINLFICVNASFSLVDWISAIFA
jgi:hypothetical protein